MPRVISPEHRTLKSSHTWDSARTATVIVQGPAGIAKFAELRVAGFPRAQNSGLKVCSADVRVSEFLLLLLFTHREPIAVLSDSSATSLRFHSHSFGLHAWLCFPWQLVQWYAAPDLSFDWTLDWPPCTPSTKFNGWGLGRGIREVVLRMEAVTGSSRRVRTLSSLGTRGFPKLQPRVILGLYWGNMRVTLG